ncbi:hypothetical protein SCUP234_09645 [Seiridium cupressi]
MITNTETVSTTETNVGSSTSTHDATGAEIVTAISIITVAAAAFRAVTVTSTGTVEITDVEFSHRNSNFNYHALLFAIENLATQVSLEVSPKYAAVSYVWGDADSGSFIHVDGAKVPVRLNLLVALKQLYDHQVQIRLWIDALCNNKNDDAGRSWQVGLMRQIFAHAEVVYINLGTQRDDSDLAMHILEKIGNMVLTSKRESEANTMLEPFDRGSATHAPVNMDRENPLG